MTEWRHWNNKAADADVPATTALAVRNTTPGPSFPPNVTPAVRRAGTRTASPRKRRRKENPVTVVDVANSTNTHTAAAALDSELQGPAADVDLEPEPLHAPSEDGHEAHKEDDDSVDAEVPVTADEYSRGRYRTTVEDVEDEGDEQGYTTSDSSESDFLSEPESVGIFADDMGPTAFEQLGEEFEREIAALGAPSSENHCTNTDQCTSDAAEGLSEDDLNIHRMPRYFRKLRLPTPEVSRTRLKFLSGVKPVMYDCCPQSCVLFAGRHAALEHSL